MPAATSKPNGGKNMSEAITTQPPALEAVLDWVLSGASEQQVSEALAAKYPEQDTQQTIKQVQSYLANSGRPNGDAVRGWALLCYRKLYQEMLRVGDYNGCRQVIKEIVCLLP